MNKRIYATIGMVISAVIIFMGLLAMTGALGGEPHYADSASYLYDTGYASFGGDFYTYVNNNAAEAADAAYAVAANIREVSSLLKSVCGVFLMGFGAFGLCHFGMIRCEYAVPYQVVETGDEDIDPEEPTTEEAAAEEPASEEV